MRTPSARDIRTFELINQQYTNRFMDWVMPRITLLGLGGVQLPPAFLVWWLHRAEYGDRILWSVILSFLLSTALVHLVKRRVKRMRPVRHTEVRFLVPKTEHGSFPSGHTATTFALAVTLAWFFPVWAVPLLLLAAAVGYSRVYVGVHFLSDVAAAAGIGVISAALCLVRFG